MACRCAPPAAVRSRRARRGTGRCRRRPRPAALRPASAARPRERSRRSTSPTPGRRGSSASAAPGTTVSTGRTFPTGVGAPILLDGLKMIGRVRPLLGHPQVSSIAPADHHPEAIAESEHCWLPVSPKAWTPPSSHSGSATNAWRQRRSTSTPTCPSKNEPWPAQRRPAQRQDATGHPTRCSRSSTDSDYPATHTRERREQYHDAGITRQDA